MSQARQKNIDKEEAQEIAALVVNQYKKEKKIWGIEFWKHLEGKGPLSKNRTYETLRNFCRNASNSKKYDWDQMFPGVPKYGQTSALRVAKDDKEKWRARTVLIWDPASVRSVAEKLSQEEDFSIEDEEFWEMFQKKHKIGHTAEQIMEFFVNYDHEFLKKCCVEVSVLNSLKEKILQQNWDAFETDESEGQTSGSNTSIDVKHVTQKEIKKEVLTQEQIEELVSNSDKTTEEDTEKIQTPLAETVDDFQIVDHNEKKEEYLLGNIPTPKADSENALKNPLKRKLHEEFDNNPPLKKSAAKMEMAKVENPRLSEITSSKLSKLRELKVQALLREVVQWWTILQRVGQSDLPQKDLFKFAFESIKSIKVLSGGNEFEENNLLDWIKLVVADRFSEDFVASQRALGVVRCMCLARKCLELSLEKTELAKFSAEPDIQ